jgi:Zn-dependent protease with chaperone function
MPPLLKPARVEPLTRRLATAMGLDWIPWIAVASGATAENGGGASSLVLIGETAVASWSEDALCGLLAHEFAHIVLGHARVTPSVAPETTALVVGYISLVSTLVGAPLAPGAYVIAGIGAVGWLVALMLVAGPTLYPGEVAADALVVERGYGPQLRAGIQSFPNLRFRTTCQFDCSVGLYTRTRHLSSDYAP